jgi:peptidoglycan/LPS O-acetylase OafA/YrhL
MFKTDSMPALTGLRGCGALAVMIYHFKDIANLFWGEDVGNMGLFKYGHFGVDLFFILSGFIICHVHFSDFKTSIELSDLKRYLALRFFRIYPLHISAMFILLLLVVVFSPFKSFQAASNTYTVKSFIVSALLIQNWGVWFGWPWNGLSWTLSVEVLLYLAFPFLCLILRRIKSARTPLICAFALLLSFGFFMQQAHFIDVNAANIRGIVRGFVGFFAGSLLSRYYRLSQKHERWPECLVALGAISLSLLLPTLRFMIYSGLALLILSLAYNPKLFGVLFGKGVIFWLGKVSFSLYLLHLMFLRFALWMLSTQLPPVRNDISKSAITAGLAIGCLVLAQLGFELIESPARKFGRRLIRKDIAPSEANSEPDRKRS